MEKNCGNCKVLEDLYSFEGKELCIDCIDNSLSQIKKTNRDNDSLYEISIFVQKRTKDNEIINHHTDFFRGDKILFEILLQEIERIKKKYQILDKIIFYTFNTYISYPFAIIPFHKFNENHIKKYKKIVVDCGVIHFLPSQKEYPYLDEFEKKVKQFGSDNVKFVIPDYPVNVLDEEERSKYKDTFLKKTQKNIDRFHTLSNTILTIQYESEDFNSFRESWNKNYDKATYIAIGNLLKSKNKLFFRKILKYIHRNNPNNYPIHFFGIGLHLYRELCSFLKKNLIEFNISFDHTKYTFPVSKQLRVKYGCGYSIDSNRQEFLIAYLDKLETIQNEINGSKQNTLNSYLK